MAEIEVERGRGPAYDDEKQDKVYESHDATVIAAGDVCDTNIDVHTHLWDGVQRRMEQRHMQMIALAGVIGTGLFLGSGKAIAHGGPAGAFLAYVVVGSVIYSVLVCLGEMAVYAPISGSYIHYAERWFHPSMGFAMGWQICFQYCISLPSEIIAASILVSFWDESFTIQRQAGYLALFAGFCIAINLLGVRWFGESEFAFAMMKIIFIIGLLIAGVCVDLGGSPDHDRIGFRYWKNPGAFAPYHSTGSLGKFLGWFTDLVQATNSYGGIEMIGFAAAEVKNPRVAVAKAIRRVFWRIAIFFCASIFVIGLLVPYTNDKLLQSTGTSASSPFVIAFDRAGIKVLPSIINAIVMLAALSSSNSILYSVSRMVYGLSLRGQAPKFLSITSKRGLPYVSLGVVSCSFALAYLTLSKGSATVFNWFQNFTALASFVCWAVIVGTYLRFKKGVEVQGMDRTQFHYYNRWQPFHAYWALFWCFIVIIFNGWEVFTKGNWSGSNFVVNYINIALFLVLAIGYQIWKRPKWVRSEDLDFVSNIPSDEEVSYEEPPPKNLFIKICNKLLT